MVWEVLRLNVPFGFLGGWKNVSVGRTGIDPLTVWYINFSLWSHHHYLGYRGMCFVFYA